MATPAWAANLPPDQMWQVSNGRDYGEGTPTFTPGTSEGAEGVWMLNGTGIQNYDPKTGYSRQPVSNPWDTQSSQLFDLRGNPMGPAEFNWRNPLMGWNGTSAEGAGMLSATRPEGNGWEMISAKNTPFLSGSELLSFAMSILGPQVLGFGGTPGETIPGAFDAGGFAAGGASMPPAIPASMGGMPGAIPEIDPTFGGALNEGAPGVFSSPGTSGFVGGPGANLPVEPNVAMQLASDTGAFDTFGSLASPINAATDARTIFDSPGFLERLQNSIGMGNTGMGGLDLSGMWDEFWKKKRAGETRGGSMGPIGSLMSVASGIYGMNRANRSTQIARESASRADPFASTREQFMQPLADAVLKPGSVDITKLPGFDAGLQAVTRKMASQGYLGSGNMMLGLKDYGESVYNNYVNRLAQLASGGSSPSAAAASLMQGGRDSSDLISRALASLGYTATRMGV